jgi:hypothetical protein
MGHVFSETAEVRVRKSVALWRAARYLVCSELRPEPSGQDECGDLRPHHSTFVPIAVPSAFVISHNDIAARVRPEGGFAPIRLMYGRRASFAFWR